MEEAAAQASSSSSAHPTAVHVVEIWENEKYVVGLIDFSLNGGEWVQHPRMPYSFKSDNSPAPEPDTYTLPSCNCKWTTNWKVRIDRNGATTDSRGWEYATRLRTFETTSSSCRQPRTMKTLTDNARRRCYYREYRSYDQNRLDEEMFNEVQVGLVIIQGIRKRLQILSNQLKGHLKEDKEVLELIKTVKSSIISISDKIRLVENSPTPNKKLSLTVNKFKSDVKKEQNHLENIGIHTTNTSSPSGDTPKTSAPSTPSSSSSSSSSITPSRINKISGFKNTGVVYNNTDNVNESEHKGKGSGNQLVGNQQILVQHSHERDNDDLIVGEEYDPIEERSKSIEKIHDDITKVITQFFFFLHIIFVYMYIYVCLHMSSISYWAIPYITLLNSR